MDVKQPSYAPVKSHEAVQAMFANASCHSLMVAEGDMASAYFYDNIDCAAYSAHASNLMCMAERPAILYHSLEPIYSQKKNWKYFMDCAVQHTHFSSES